MQFNASIDETYLGVGDLDFFVDSWSDNIPFKKDHLTDIHINAHVNG
jgi:hypothetical protein